MNNAMTTAGSVGASRGRFCWLRPSVCCSSNGQMADLLQLVRTALTRRLGNHRVQGMQLLLKQPASHSDEAAPGVA